MVVPVIVLTRQKNAAAEIIRTGSGNYDNDFGFHRFNSNEIQPWTEIAIVTGRDRWKRTGLENRALGRKIQGRDPAALQRLGLASASVSRIRSNVAIITGQVWMRASTSPVRHCCGHQFLDLLARSAGKRFPSRRVRPRADLVRRPGRRVERTRDWPAPSGWTPDSVRGR